MPIVLIAVFCFGKSASKVDPGIAKKTDTETKDDQEETNQEENSAENDEQEEAEEAEDTDNQKAPVSKSDLEEDEAQPEVCFTFSVLNQVVKNNKTIFIQ